MIFIGGISSKEKKLDFQQTFVCESCGKYGRYEVFMRYEYLSLFFIPTLKWNKKYYVVESCCGSVYSIDKELGKRIENGEQVILREQDLQLVQSGRGYSVKHCPNCGFETYENFQYCPRCASPLR